MSVKELSAIECWELLKNNQNHSFLIDVRNSDEWLETGIADLSSINNETKLITFIYNSPYLHLNNKFIDELEQTIANKEAFLFFICKSGGRSAKAALLASQNGYSNCYNVNDGFVGNIFDSNLQDANLNGWLGSKLPRKDHAIIAK